MELIEQILLRQIEQGEKINLKILAMSQMYQGVCIAGVNEKNEWIRPIRAKPSKNTIFDRNLRFDYPRAFERFLTNVNKYKKKTFIFKGKAGTIPHSEDYILYSPNSTLFKSLDKDEKSHIRMKLNLPLDEISDYECIRLLQSLDETDKLRKSHKRPEDYLLTNNRSLMLVKPDKIIECTRLNYRQQYKPYIEFKINGIPTLNYRCTDLQWMSLGKYSIEKANQYFLNDEEIYFVIGLSRLDKKMRSHPLIVGIHTVPLHFKKISIDFTVLSNAQ